MTSTFTPNFGFELPANGDLVGTWDTPETNNTATLDLICGGTATIPVSNTTVVLSAAQYKCRHLVFTGVLTSSLAIVFPTGFAKSWEIENQTIGNNSFYIVLTTAVNGTAYVAAPPGEIVEISGDGNGLLYKNFGRIGEYMDLASSAIPPWVGIAGFWNVLSAPCWINCDGSAFSSTTYPYLAKVLGGTTLPDHRGRTRAALNQGTGRTGTIINGNVALSGGGTDGVTLVAAGHIPTITMAGAATFFANVADVVFDASGFVTTAQEVVAGRADNNAKYAVVGSAFGTPTISGVVSVVTNNAGGGAHVNTQPTYVGGQTLIRAR